ncbi:hypothetical protein ACFPRL_17285 [Pseudoclavibacter helvolus]
MRARPATKTSTARKFRSGRSAAAATTASPVPEPISTTSGASRPNSSAGSTRNAGFTEKSSSARSTSTRYLGPSVSHEVC